MPQEGLGNISKMLLETFQSPKYQPPRLPEVAQELLRLSQDQRASINEFVDLLQRDQLLAGRVLQVANSPFYSPTRHAEVGSLHRAVVRLGLRALSNIVMETWLGLRVFRSQRYADAMRRLSHHAVVTAHACQITAKHACVDSDDIFLCGLLHDVGIAGALTTLEESTADDTSPALPEAAREIDLIHGRLSEVMARLWQLPDSITLTVRFHHQPITPAGPNRHASVVCIAEELANRIEWSFADPGLAVWQEYKPDTSTADSIQAAMDILGLDSEDLGRMLVELEETVERLTWIH